jgi:hypothetical protein
MPEAFQRNVDRNRCYAHLAAVASSGGAERGQFCVGSGDPNSRPLADVHHAGRSRAGVTRTHHAWKPFNQQLVSFLDAADDHKQAADQVERDAGNADVLPPTTSKHGDLTHFAMRWLVVHISKPGRSVARASSEISSLYLNSC